MGQKILVAFDDSENAMRTVAFISQTFGTQHAVVLFSVLPDTATLCDMNSPELTPHFVNQQSNFCLLEDEKQKLMRSALDKARNALIDAGFNEDAITVKIGTKKRGVARDIVAEAEQGYDLVVIGRRGVSAVKEFFLGSISQKVLNLAKDVSVLIVN